MLSTHSLSNTLLFMQNGRKAETPWSTVGAARYVRQPPRTLEEIPRLCQPTLQGTNHSVALSVDPFVVVLYADLRRATNVEQRPPTTTTTPTTPHVFTHLDVPVSSVSRRRPRESYLCGEREFARYVRQKLYCPEFLPFSTR